LEDVGGCWTALVDGWLALEDVGGSWAANGDDWLALEADGDGWLALEDVGGSWAAYGDAWLALEGNGGFWPTFKGRWLVPLGGGRHLISHFFRVAPGLSLRMTFQACGISGVGHLCPKAQPLGSAPPLQPAHAQT
jgi:hypothetical protein